jgi:hypothetical protein
MKALLKLFTEKKGKQKDMKLFGTVAGLYCREELFNTQNNILPHFTNLINHFIN